MKRLHDRWIVFQLALLLCLVHGWCACGDVRTAFCINAGFVRDDIQKLKDYLPTRDAAYFLPTLRGWCVNFTDGFCVPVLAGQVAKEHVQQCYQAHEALHKIMHKKVTVEQRYLEELAADKSDVLLLSFGSVGYEHQQIPRFFERFVMQFPQSSFAIFSAGKPCDPATDFSVFSQKGTRTRPFNEQWSGVPKGDVIVSMHEHSQHKLVLHEYEDYLPVQDGLIEPRDLQKENLTNPYKFGQALIAVLTEKLKSGAVVIFANHTACPFGDISQITRVYDILKKDYPQTVQMYTQVGQGKDCDMCVVYEPPLTLKSALTLYWASGQHWLTRERGIKKACALFSGDDFCVPYQKGEENAALAFSYQLARVDDHHVRVVGVSGKEITALGDRYKARPYQGSLLLFTQAEREAYAKTHTVQPPHEATAVVHLPAIAQPKEITDDIQWVGFMSVREAIETTMNKLFPSVYEKNLIVTAVAQFNDVNAKNIEACTKELGTLNNYLDVSNMRIGQLGLDLIKVPSAIPAATFMPLWYLHDLRIEMQNSELILLTFGALGNEYHEVPRFMQKLMFQHPIKRMAVFGIGAQKSIFVRKESDLKRGFNKNFRPIKWSFDVGKNVTYEYVRGEHVDGYVRVLGCQQGDLMNDNAFMQEVFSILLEKGKQGASIIIGNNTGLNFDACPNVALLYRLLQSNGCNVQLYSQSGQSECVVYDPQLFPFDDMPLYHDAKGVYLGAQMKGQWDECYCAVCAGAGMSLAETDIVKWKNVYKASEVLSQEYAAASRAQNGKLAVFGVSGLPAVVYAGWPNILYEKEKPKIQVQYNDPLLLKGGDFSALLGTPEKRAAYIGTTHAHERLQAYLDAIVALHTQVTPFDNCRVEVKEKVSGLVGSEYVERLLEPTKTISQFFMAKDGFWIMQVPALNQYEWYQKKVNQYEQNPTNYCGYYAVFHAVELLEFLKAMGGITQQSLLEMVGKNYQSASSQRAKFVPVFGKMLNVVSGQGGLKRPPYDNIPDEQIQHIIDSAGKHEDLGVFALENIEYAGAGITQSLFGAVVPPVLIKFFDRKQDCAVIVLRVGANHWIALAVTLIENKIAFLVSDSLGNRNWQSEDGAALLKPLYDFIVSRMKPATK